MKKEKFNFKTPLHLACSDDNLRPTFQYVHFIDGWAYATNAMVLVKQSLDDYCDVLDKENLNGHALHADSFKKILRYDTVQAFDDCVKGWKDNGSEVVFPYAKEGITAPDFKKVLEQRLKPNLIRSENNNEASMGSIIGLNPHFVAIVGDVLYDGRKHTPLRLTMGKQYEAVIAEPINVDEYPNQMALIMPLTLDVC